MPRKRALPVGWYPDTRPECERVIGEFVRGFAPPEGNWVGGIVPHAGWFFSGRAAARVMKTLASAGPVDRVVVYGGHLHGGADPIVYTDDAWDTPLGSQALDKAISQELVSSKLAVAAGRNFADNTVEVQLPFVRYFFPKASAVAVHSPSSDVAIRLGSSIVEIIRERGLKAVYVGSADLTHYGPNYGFSPKGTGAAAVEWVKGENDRSVIDKAVAMDAAGVLQDAQIRHNTCSAGPIASVVASAAKLGVTSGKLIDYYTSYDVIPGSSFVGYAAIVF
ncbi:MAG: AmmeMemoRadiSam system protein B [Desulfomonile sp.]|nr:AmmeMemoRadiSam system protein B [Desulfomonile sp.]